MTALAPGASALLWLPDPQSGQGANDIFLYLRLFTLSLLFPRAAVRVALQANLARGVMALAAFFDRFSGATRGRWAYYLRSVSPSDWRTEKLRFSFGKAMCAGTCSCFTEKPYFTKNLSRSTLLGGGIVPE